MKNKERIGYLICFLLLLAVEFYIGIFVHDRFVRPYVGDVIVVIVLYALIRIFFLEKPACLSLWILLFAVFVEITQIYPLVDLLEIKNRFLRVLMGTSFAWEDLVAYAAGTVITFLWDLRLMKRNRER